MKKDSGGATPPTAEDERIYKLVSFNVNGIRSATRKGFLDWLAAEDPDAVCLQETKAREEQADPALRPPDGYHASWNSAERPGYSGVATFTKIKPRRVRRRLGPRRFDREGRLIETDFPEFTLLNVYFPNGGQGPERIAYKLDFYAALLQRCDELHNAGRLLVVCGDYNTAHQAIDLARPKQNQKTSGFLPEERAWIDRYLDAGFLDAFRELCDEPEHYTWWSFRARSRERNVGWRIDYHLISKQLQPHLRSANIHRDIALSDHCPISIELAF